MKNSIHKAWRPRRSIGIVILALLTVTGVSPLAAQDPVIHGIEVVNTYPHDTTAFTQGLVYSDGALYEGTGRNGQSSLRRFDLESGDLQQRHNLASRYFGEGITIMGERIYQLTWRSHIGFVYDKDTFDQVKTFFLPGEGWGITHDGEFLIVSDGTDRLRFLDPATQSEVRSIQVSLNGNPVRNLNELEYIRGEIWANVWYEDFILRIDPASGAVNSLVDLTGLNPRKGNDEVLNGIAWDAENDRLFVTGKLWPALFEITLTE